MVFYEIAYTPDQSLCGSNDRRNAFDLICDNLKRRYTKSYLFLTSDRGSLDRDDGSIGKLILNRFGLVSIGVAPCLQRSESIQYTRAMNGLLGISFDSSDRKYPFLIPNSAVRPRHGRYLGTASLRVGHYHSTDCMGRIYYFITFLLHPPTTLCIISLVKTTSICY